ncbi:hypothetical protein L596_018905 [Steinernema carpocapsae]|uniref:F-box domain-containing protein n=1 Tax=Steinernema carpocapsae TaxID=34508 RepID=A0A4U5N6R7_STECR|nr:hypothetical protein L596_018905 [Steinernema carpocapsae]
MVVRERRKRKRKTSPLFEARDRCRRPTKSARKIQKSDLSFGSTCEVKIDLTHDEHSIEPISFSDLPPDIQLMIIERLPPRTRVLLETVSRAWQALVRRSWRILEAEIPSTITSSFGIDSITDVHVCGFLAKVGLFLRRIDFYIPSESVGIHVLHSISQRCPCLSELRLVTEVDGRSLSHLLRLYSTYQSSQLKKLKKFSLVYNYSTSIHNGLRHLNRSLSNLHTYRLDITTMPPNVNVLFPISSQLKCYSIHLSRIQNALGGLRPQWIYDFFDYLSGFYSELEDLEISFCHQDKLNEEVMYSLIQDIAQAHDLRRFCLAMRSSNMDPQSIWFGRNALRALHYFKRLEFLSLVAVHVPHDFQKYIPPTVKGLRLSVIQNIGHSMLLSTMNQVPNLQILHLVYGQSTVNDEDQLRTSTVVEILKICQRLKELELNLCEFVDKLEIARFLRDNIHDCMTRNSLDAPVQLVVTLVQANFTRRLINLLRKSLGCCSKFELRSKGHATITVHRVCQRNVAMSRPARPRSLAIAPRP